jgi:hypothetical protein
MTGQINQCATRVRVVGGCSGQGGGHRLCLSGASMHVHTVHLHVTALHTCTGYAMHVQAMHPHVSVCLRPRRRVSSPET